MRTCVRLPRSTGRAAFSSAPSLAKATGQDDLNGSQYENYTAAAQVYDGIRHVGGVEVILGAWLSGVHKPLHQQDVLDIGCGTGNYVASVAPHVGSLTCIRNIHIFSSLLTRPSTNFSPDFGSLNIDFLDKTCL